MRWAIEADAPGASRGIELSLSPRDIGVVAGFFLVLLAAVMNGAYAIPMRFMTRWKWENIWLLWTVLSLWAIPVAMALGCRAPSDRCLPSDIDGSSVAHGRDGLVVGGRCSAFGHVVSARRGCGRSCCRTRLRSSHGYTCCPSSTQAHRCCRHLQPYWLCWA